MQSTEWEKILASHVSGLHPEYIKNTYIIMVEDLISCDKNESFYPNNKNTIQLKGNNRHFPKKIYIRYIKVY
jgi:hypothetical protein